GASAPAQEPGTPSFAERFLADRAYRRASLERSVVNPDNGYSALRLAEYAVERGGTPVGWDALDEWNPLVRPVRIDGLGEPSAPVWDAEDVRTDAQWQELGRRAFELYPVELDDAVGSLALDATARQRFGLWADDRGRVAGLVYVTTAD